MYQKCEICRGEIDHGICIACGLPVDDYLPDEDVDYSPDDQKDKQNDTLLRPSSN